MIWLTKFRRLTARRRRMVISCVGLLLVVRAGLRLFTYQKVNELLERSARRRKFGREPALDSPESAEDIVWAVTSAAGRIPGTNCLPRALVGRYLLLRAGCPARVRFGVMKESNGDFAAHAWLESRDRVLIGGETMLEYSPMPAFPPDAA